MIVQSDGTSSSLHPLLVALTAVVAVGLGLFLALAGGASDAAAIGVGVGYFAAIQGLLRAISMVGTREAW